MIGQVGYSFLAKDTDSYYTVVQALPDGTLKCEHNDSGSWCFVTASDLEMLTDRYGRYLGRLRFAMHAYEQDDGELSEDQLAAIRAASSTTDLPPEKFTESLFQQPNPEEGSSQVDKTLAERGKRYGKFKEVSETIQGLKSVMHTSRNWDKLTASQKESLEMIQHKIARMLNGDPTYEDNAVDIVGYATLMLKNMQGDFDI